MGGNARYFEGEAATGNRCIVLETGWTDSDLLTSLRSHRQGGSISGDRPRP